MKRLITTITMVMLLFFAVGCGENSSTSRSSLEEGDSSGVIIKVSMDNRKNKNTIYQATKNMNCLKVTKVLLSYRIHNDNLQLKYTTLLPNTTSLNGVFSFSISLDTSTNYDFKAEAYNIENHVIATAELNNVSIAQGVIINLILSQNPNLTNECITIEPFSVKTQEAEVVTLTKGPASCYYTRDGLSQIFTVNANNKGDFTFNIDEVCSSLDINKQLILNCNLEDDESILFTNFLLTCPSSQSDGNGGDSTIESEIQVHEFRIEDLILRYDSGNNIFHFNIALNNNVVVDTSNNMSYPATCSTSLDGNTWISVNKNDNSNHFLFTINNINSNKFKLRCNVIDMGSKQTPKPSASRHFNITRANVIRI